MSDRRSTVAIGVLALGTLLGADATAEAAGAPTWTTLSSSSNPVLVGQPVTFTATVKPIGGGATPTGTATFKDAAAVLGAVTLDGTGRATFTTAALGLGTHPITAVYDGDGSFGPSASDVLHQAVPDVTACSAPGLYPAAGSPVTGDAVGTAVADFDGDGKPDLVVMKRSTEDVTIHLGDGTGGFVAGSPAPVAAAYRLVVSDFNGDEKPDVAVVWPTDGQPAGSYASILLGNGSGGLAAAGPPLLLDASPSGSVAVGDLNVDGKADLAVGLFDPDPATGHVAILLEDGSGNLTSTAPELNTGSYPWLVARDLNLDGRPDLAVDAGYESRTVTAFLGNGSGGFTIGPVTSTGLQSFPYIVAGDFNLDGKPDLAARSYIWNRMAILLGDGGGGFGVLAGPSVTNPLGIAVSDFNLDGRPDLAVGAGGRIAILLGDGAGSFVQADSPKPAGGDPVVGDFNRDGRPDLAVTSGDLSATVSVLLNNCGAPASVTA